MLTQSMIGYLFLECNVILDLPTLAEIPVADSDGDERQDSRLLCIRHTLHD